MLRGTHTTAKSSSMTYVRNLVRKEWQARFVQLTAHWMDEFGTPTNITVIGNDRQVLNKKITFSLAVFNY